MISFFLRKNFYDGWDNLFDLLAPNLLINSLFLFMFYLAYLTRESLAVWILLAVLFVFVYSLFSLALARSMHSSLKGEIRAAPFALFRTVLKNLLPSLKDAFIFASLTSVLFCFAVSAYLLFFRLHSSVLSLSAGFCYLWLFALLALTLGYYPSLSASLEVSPIRRLRFALLIVLDNPLPCFFLVFYSLSLIALSVFFLGTVPGLSGLSMAKENAVRLFLKKYDFISKNTDGKNGFSWKKVLKAEKEALSMRGIKDFLFPWK